MGPVTLALRVRVGTSLDARRHFAAMRQRSRITNALIKLMTSAERHPARVRIMSVGRYKSCWRQGNPWWHWNTAVKILLVFLTKLKVPTGVGDTGTIDFRDRRIVISWSAGAIPEGRS
jgi:hypothetical protein